MKKMLGKSLQKVIQEVFKKVYQKVLESDFRKIFFWKVILGKLSKKKNRGFSEFGTKGGRVSDLNHYFEQQ